MRILDDLMQRLGYTPTTSVVEPASLSATVQDMRSDVAFLRRLSRSARQDDRVTASALIQLDHKIDQAIASARRMWPEAHRWPLTDEVRGLPVS